MGCADIGPIDDRAATPLKQEKIPISCFLSGMLSGSGLGLRHSNATFGPFQPIDIKAGAGVC